MNLQKKQKRPLNQYVRFSGLLFQMIAIIGLGTFLGIKLDEKYPNEHSIYTLITVFISVVISIYFVVRQGIRFSKDNNDK